MAVLLDQNSLVTTLKQVPGPSVILIEELRIHTVQLPHAEGKIALRGLDEKVVMVGHEAICVTDPIIPFVDVLEGIEEQLPIVVILENGFLLVPAGRHMVDSAGVFYAKRAGHEATIAENEGNCNERDLTLRCSLLRGILCGGGGTWMKDIRENGICQTARPDPDMRADMR